MDYIFRLHLTGRGRKVNKSEFYDELKNVGLEKMISRMGLARNKYSAISDELITVPEHVMCYKQIIQDIDVRDIHGTLHIKYEKLGLSWHTLFRAYDLFEIPFFDEHIHLANTKPYYIHNIMDVTTNMLSDDSDNIEMIKIDNRFFIKNGNRRTIIAKHLFVAENYYTGNSDYLIKNVLVYYTIEG